MCPPKAPKAPEPQPERPLRYLLSRDQARRAGMNTGGTARSNFIAPIFDPNHTYGAGPVGFSGDDLNRASGSGLAA